MSKCVNMKNGSSDNAADSKELSLKVLEKVSGGTGTQQPPKAKDDDGEGILLPEIDV